MAKLSRNVHVKIDRTCLFCGKGFSTYYQGGLTTKFCTQSCRGSFVGALKTVQSIEKHDREGLVGKKCGFCGETKEASEFQIKGRDKAKRELSNRCKVCTHIYQRGLRLRQIFNMSGSDYEDILRHQSGACAVCKRPPTNIRLSIDHDHKSGLIRGLLCHNCNRTAGAFKDNISLFEAIIDYLKNPPATKALGGQRFGIVGRATNKKRKMGGPHLLQKTQTP